MDRDGSSSDPVSAQETGILESTRGLTAVLDCLPHSAWIFDRSGRYVFQNRIDRETHGSAVGLLPSEAGLGPEEGQAWTQMHLRVIGGERVHYSREMETSRGRVVSETSIEPVMVDGVIIGGVGVSVDQTARTDAVRRLNEAHQRLAEFVAVSSDWVWETDEEHRFTSVIGDGGRLGLDFAGWIGRTRWQVANGDPVADPLWRGYAETVARHAPIDNFIFSTLRGDGEPMWTEVNGRPRFSTDGRFLGYRGVTRDVTRRETMAEQLRRSDIVIRATNNAVVVCDRAGRVRWVNTAFERLTGYTQAEVLGQKPGALLQCPETDPATVREMSAAIAEGRPVRVQVLNQSRNGRRYWLDLDIRPIAGEGAEPEGFVGVQTDVTELVEARALLHDVIETIPDAIAAFDAEDRLILFNRSYRDYYALSAKLIREGTPFEDILRHGVAAGQYMDPGSTPEQREAWIRNRIAIHRDPPSEPSIQLLSDGRWLQVSERRSTSGAIVGVRADITALKQAELAIRRTAETDGLTQLANRSVMTRELDKALQGKRLRDQVGVFIIIDLDHFKSINDTLGHDAGDALLRVVAQRLRRLLRRGDVVARLGGDEFAVLLTGLADELAAERMAQKLHKALTARTRLGDRMMRPGISMGVTLFPADGETPTDIIKNADIALYQSKAQGRNCWTLFNPQLRRRLERRQELGDALRGAISAEDIDVAFQPQLGFGDHRIVGFEVLARWQYGGQAISPLEFVGIAEDLGLGGVLGRAIMERAFATFSKASAGRADAGQLAINLATSQLKDPHFPEYVTEALARYGLRPKQLEFEVTETVLLDRSAERIAETLGALRQLGISLALDDFGTGYASLTHLKRFPVSRLKIDQSFVRNIGQSDDDAAIVRAIIGLAHSLGMTTVAEGVETREQLAFLARLGCDIGQGFFIGRPAPHPVWSVDPQGPAESGRLAI
ncbi:bifunctional diguanylate cyclase/phosphodiesterase [Stappia indica]|uniref:PAS domain S-box-containing protein/diguanylate cyclase (GGDEF) domain-containing protein n=1 Tax=Stappia indica TaxID=538381 RepID=A0A285S4U5_9HYPH|nr:bifunctional diguanylate cyclase/phosphodiesterase [Stappia indica]SOB99934.1 PAS domain S-box-containing protein/diguanylate cyclase (GGDEF) domain-containing protein [Stappia indica]